MPSEHSKNSPSTEESTKLSSSHIREDLRAILLLMLLYLLQGIPLGVASSVQYMLRTRHIGYKQQAIFSLSDWPYSLKLFWAPIVDSVFFKRVGRRKSWLGPVQVLIAIALWLLSLEVGDLLGPENGDKEINVILLALIFFTLTFLAATQDIVVDGWALNMLSKRNVGWASTCNTVGQSTGYFISNALFLALESSSFCNAHLRSVPKSNGIWNLKGFLQTWAIIYVIVTILVLLLKREKKPQIAVSNVYKSYSQLCKILTHPPVKQIVFLHLTSKVGYAATEILTNLRLIDAGVPRHNLALMSMPMVPINIILPLALSKLVAGPRPFTVFLKSLPPRLLMCLGLAGVVYWAKVLNVTDGVFPTKFYFALFIVQALYQTTAYACTVGTIGFHCKVADPGIGGTYMTLLNTATNLGFIWPSTLGIYIVDLLSDKPCKSIEGGYCYNQQQIQNCIERGGECRTLIDGFYIEVIMGIVLGCVWLKIFYRKAEKLQDLASEDWQVGA